MYTLRSEFSQEYRNKVDRTFEEIVADLANTRFNKTVFEGTATAQAFEWDIAMETYWPAHSNRLKEKWEAGNRTQGVWRSERIITWSEWNEMFQSLPHSRPIRLVQSAYVKCLLRGDSTKLVQQQHRILYERQNEAAQLAMHMYGFRVILKDTFAPGDLDSHQPTSISQPGRPGTICWGSRFIYQSSGRNHDRFQFAATTFDTSSQRSRTAWIGRCWWKQQMDTHLLGARTCRTWRQGPVEGSWLIKEVRSCCVPCVWVRLCV